MIHLHPELLADLGYDAFDYAGHHLRGRPQVGAARRTPILAVAAGTGRSKDALEYLLAARADVAATDLELWSAHHLAAYSGKRAELEMLLNTAPPASPQPWTLTPLHLAAAEGHEDCIELLLQHRACSPNIAAPEGWRLRSPEHITHADPAAVHHQSALLAQLGRSQVTKPLGGLAPLHLAAVFGHSDCTVALLNARADPNAATENHLTALLLCLKKWHLPVGNPRKLGGKRLRGEHQDYMGVFEALLRAGARDLTPDAYETSLHTVAFHWGSVEPQLAQEVGAKLLDEAGSRVDARGPSGGTPLHWAVNGRNWAACRLLLDRGADPSSRNDVDRAVWELPVLKETGRWPHADAEVCRQSLLGLASSFRPGRNDGAEMGMR